jgi:uncharacterized protein (DUF433 family)
VKTPRGHGFRPEVKSDVLHRLSLGMTANEICEAYPELKPSQVRSMKSDHQKIQRNHRSNPAASSSLRAPNSKRFLPDVRAKLRQHIADGTAPEEIVALMPGITLAQIKDQKQSIKRAGKKAKGTQKAPPKSMNLRFDVATPADHANQSRSVHVQDPVNNGQAMPAIALDSMEAALSREWNMGDQFSLRQPDGSTQDDSAGQDRQSGGPQQPGAFHPRHRGG